MEAIGKEIKDILRSKEISLYRVAKDLGIAKESLHRSLMDGGNPEWNTIKKIIDYLNYEVKLVKKKKNVNPG
jgi:probable addiction module antidote protein